MYVTCMYTYTHVYISQTDVSLPYRDTIVYNLLLSVCVRVQMYECITILYNSTYIKALEMILYAGTSCDTCHICQMDSASLLLVSVLKSLCTYIDIFEYRAIIYNGNVLWFSRIICHKEQKELQIVNCSLLRLLHQKHHPDNVVFYINLYGINCFA